MDTAHLVYFCALGCSEVFQKRPGNWGGGGGGRGQFYAGVNGLIRDLLHD